MKRFSTFVVALVAVLVPSARAMAASCEELATLTLANTTLTSVTTVAAGAFTPPNAAAGAPLRAYAALPAFCRVAATLRPSSDSEIRIEVWLPMSTWNGKFQAVGNGGWAGSLPYPALAAALSGGYATVGTDTGHTGNTAQFALGHPEKVIDMGYRAVHEMTVQAKRVIDAFYQRPPQLSFFNSCSTGGRQGITEAVRFPADFDAIVAGAPAVDWMHLHAGRMALNQSVNKTPLHVIPPEKYPLVHAAVIAACDGLDGVRDGVLENPIACRFDPQELACKAGDAQGCLTAPQVDAARAFYEPVTDPATGAVVMPGLQRGTELAWGTLGGPQPIVNSIEAFKYVVFQDAAWDWRRFDLAADLRRGDEADKGVLASANPDLRTFVERGGKLLMYHGWSDPQIPPGNTVSFFNEIVRRLGEEEVGRSVQLYMVPGMNHCQGGPGTDTFDKMAAIEQWVATGRAPAQIPASHLTNGVVDRARPLCPYGQVAKWGGSGSTDQAENFSCVAEPRLRRGP